MITRSKDRESKEQQREKTDEDPDKSSDSFASPSSTGTPQLKNPIVNKVRHSYTFSSPSTLNKHPKTSPKASGRRASSNSSPSQNGVRRRSFLSNTMISNEKHLVYQLQNYGYESSPIYSINLTESQGFVWNQDLFASQNLQEHSIIYDDEDGSNNPYSDVFEDDDEEDRDEDMDLNQNTRITKNGTRSMSYSASNDSGINKVKVINIKVDENDNRY